MPCERVFLPPLSGSEKRRHSIHDIPVTIYDDEEIDSDEEKGNVNALPTVPEAEGSPRISCLGKVLNSLGFLYLNSNLLLFLVLKPSSIFMLVLSACHQWLR